MQYEISGSVLAGQITTTTWAVAPSRTWAWSRAIGGAGRGIGGAGQFASWTRAAQLRTSTWAEAAVARATVPPRRSTLRWTCPGRALGEGSGRSGLGGGSVEDLGLVQGDRWGWPRHRRSWPARVVDQGGSARGVRLGGGSGGPGHGTPPGVQLCGGPAQGAPWAKAAVDRAWARRGPGRLSSRRRPGRWLRRGPGHERLHSGAHSLCCCQQAVCRRGLRGGRAKGGAILTAQGSRRQCCAICLRGRLLRMCYLSNWRHFGG